MSGLRCLSSPEQLQLRKAPVGVADVVAAGDLVLLSKEGVIQLPSILTPAVLTMELRDYSLCQLTSRFLGVAHQDSPRGSAEPIDVDVSPHSVYEFDVLSGQFHLGDLLTFAVDPNGRLHNQRLLRTSDYSLAIARAAEAPREISNVLRVTFASAFATGSANVNAQMGHPATR